MEGLAVERRTTGASRIPLESLVQLSHEDFDEPFEAEGVDLGLGGLAMRAPYLPDVGDRLRCRFDGVAAEAEVVEGDVEERVARHAPLEEQRRPPQNLAGLALGEEEVAVLVAL